MAIKFATNTPQTLSFPYGDFKPVNGTYGPQFLYTVDVNGQRDKLYATPLLHEQLQTIGLNPGDAFTITKVEDEGNRKSWIIQPNGNRNGNGYPDAPNDPSCTDAIPSVSPASNAPPPPPDFASIQQLMTHCLQASFSSWHSVDNEAIAFTSDDIRRTALSLFIECSRRGICPQPAETPDTAAVAAEAEEPEDDLPF